MTRLIEALTTGSVLTIVKVPGNCKARLGSLTVYGKTPVNCLWNMEKKLETERTSDGTDVGSGSDGRGLKG